MLVLLLEFLALAAVVVVAGVVLARCCDKIADLTGLGKSLVGLVLLASATSLPEFTVAWKSVRIGAIDLTMGDVLGSSLINLLILSILDLTHKTRGKMLSRTAAAHALSAVAAMLLTGIVLLFMLLDVKWTIWRFGRQRITYMRDILPMPRPFCCANWMVPKLRLLSRSILFGMC